MRVLALLPVVPPVSSHHVTTPQAPRSAAACCWEPQVTALPSFLMVPQRVLFFTNVNVINYLTFFTKLHLIATLTGPLFKRDPLVINEYVLSKKSFVQPQQLLSRTLNMKSALLCLLMFLQNTRKKQTDFTEIWLFLLVWQTERCGQQFSKSNGFN